MDIWEDVGHPFWDHCVYFQILNHHLHSYWNGLVFVLGMRSQLVCSNFPVCPSSTHTSLCSVQMHHSLCQWKDQQRLCGIIPIVLIWETRLWEATKLTREKKRELCCTTQTSPHYTVFFCDIPSGLTSAKQVWSTLQGATQSPERG